MVKSRVEPAVVVTMRKKISNPFFGHYSPSTSESVKPSGAQHQVAKAATTLPPFVQQIDLQALSKKAGTTVSSRGVLLAREPGRFNVETVLPNLVALDVYGDTDTYETEFFIDEKGDLNSVCNCPYADGILNQVCKHTVAVAIYLKNLYITQRVEPATPAAPIPPNAWRYQLQGVLAPTPTSSSAKARGEPALLVFALTPHHRRYLMRPVAITAAAVPEALWQTPEQEHGQQKVQTHNSAALRAYLLAHGEELQQQKALKSLTKQQLSQHHFLNVPDWQLPLLDQTALEVQNSSYNDYYYGANTDSARLWQLLATALVFRGTVSKLLAQPLTVLAERAELRLSTAYVKAGLQLTATLVLPTRVLPLRNQHLTVYNEEPLWVGIGTEMCAVQANLQQLMAWQKLGSLLIPHASVAEFFQQDFADLVRRYPLQDDNVIARTIEHVLPKPRLYLSEQGKELLATLRFAYDDHECGSTGAAVGESYLVQPEDLPQTDANTASKKVSDSATSPPSPTPRVLKVKRNIDSEQTWFTQLAKAEFGLRAGHAGDGVPPGTLVLRKTINPFVFLKDKVPALAAAGVAIYGESALTLARINRNRPTIAFNITSNIDWFDVKTEIAFGDMTVSLTAVRKALRNDRFIKLADGSMGEIPEEWLQKYKHLFGLGDVQADGLRLARHHVALLDQLVESQAAVTTDQKFEQARQRFKHFQGIDAKPLPSEFKGELRPYQKAGFDWLHFLRESNFGGCLADDMGTGKTVQTLAFLQSLQAPRTAKGKRKKSATGASAAHLLVLPRSLITNWEREAAKFAPTLKVLDFSTGERIADIASVDDYDLVLTTYGVLLREIDRLQHYEFDTVILDEAQAIKNPLSESAKAVRQLKTRHRLTLTGTPVENSTIELWSQFAFLNPGLLGSLEYFREGFANPIEKQQDEASMHTLRKLVYPFILRRTKEQVATELPPRSEKILWEDMEPAQRTLYDATRDSYRAKLLKLIEEKGIKDARFQVLEGLLRLRQICNHPKLYKKDYRGDASKLGTLLDTLTTLQAEGHKTLVFSQFVGMLKLIEADLKKAGIRYTYLDGSTRNRQAAVDKFQAEQEIKVFLISLKAGGVGLNLTAADYVIHVDPWWNPAVEMQATDRAHRIGQQRPVFVYKLLMRDSVEEKILHLQERKRTLVKNLITTEAGFFKQLTAEDISGLFS
jgi:non-specific serine/threonine protein kinase